MARALLALVDMGRRLPRRRVVLLPDDAVSSDGATHAPLDAEGELVGAPPAHLARNVMELIQRRRREHANARLDVRIADRITRLAGTLTFVIAHALLFAVWLSVNTGLLPGILPFDPYPFNMLTTVVSLEAIFLSAFLLISQNRMQDLAERRAELDLHVNLLAEREATEVLRKLTRVEAALGIAHEDGQPAVDELLKGTPAVEIAEGVTPEFKPES